MRKSKKRYSIVLIILTGRNRLKPVINRKTGILKFLPVTICLWSGASKFCLKKKSPKARDIANAPFTLLNSTQPPPSLFK